MSVAGTDEAGRGPLAGPVVAAAVVLPPHVTPEWLAGCDDSKRVDARRREALVPRIQEVALAWMVAEVSVAEIDAINIAQASFEAMRRAVAGLSTRPEHVLVDGLPNPRLNCPQTALVGGDGLSLSIAAASILAKVHRDAQMCLLDERYPGYGFSAHKGYPTAAHRQAIARLGPCAAHRRSFRLT